jgi:hypothetical protein
MSNRLSHSSVSKFQECPTAWNYHYNKKLRHRFQSSALCFGSAIDKALEAVMKKHLNPKEVFLDTWTTQEINKVSQDLTANPNIVYSESDIDLDLINETDAFYIKQKYPNWEYDYDIVVKKKATYGFKNLEDDERSLYNFVAWNSLKNKGFLMIDAFEKKILPKIKRVIALQKEIKLENEAGDKITGFADMVCEWENGDILVLDFKTSSRNYEETAVLTSPQLALYVYALFEEYKTRKAGYIVLNKRVSKNKTKICSKCGFNGTGNRSRTCPEEFNDERCAGEWIEKINPEIYIQTIIDEIPEQTENIVIDNIEFINNSIKNGIFYRNLQSCVKPWGPCPYFNLCYKNDSSDLIEVK